MLRPLSGEAEASLQALNERVSEETGQRPQGPPRTLRPLEGEGEAQRSWG